LGLQQLPIRWLGASPEPAACARGMGARPRIAVEFAHPDEFGVEGFGEPKPDAITYPPESRVRFERLIARGKPTLNFAAHLANWELPAVGVASLGARTAVPYRRPNIRAIDDVIIKLRAPLMGELIATGLYAPVKLGRLSKMRSSRCAMPTVRSTSGAPCR
jgi:Kdo2-lipid IVA lauroyltransferase/acyltransferase